MPTRTISICMKVSQPVIVAVQFMQVELPPLAFAPFLYDTPKRSAISDNKISVCAFISSKTFVFTPFSFQTSFVLLKALLFTTTINLTVLLSQKILYSGMLVPIKSRSSYLIFFSSISISDKSAGSHCTSYNSLFVSHLAASASLRTRLPEFTFAKKQSIER